MDWRPLSDRSLSSARRFRAVRPGVLRGSGARTRPPAGAVAPCQAAATDREPRLGWPASRSGPRPGGQPCLSPLAAGLQAGRPERPSAGPLARRGSLSRCQAVRARGGSGPAPADSRNPMERSAAAAACESPSLAPGLPSRRLHASDSPAGPNGPWQELDSDMPGIPRTAAIPVERPMTRTVVRPRVTGGGAH